MDEDFEEPTPDDVCVKNADKGVKITLRDLDEDYVMFEGTREGLLFLSELFRAQALDPEHDKNHLHPKGAGQVLFTKGSTRGFYILLHRA